jgi:AraC family transcriptional regulator
LPSRAVLYGEQRTLLDLSVGRVTDQRHHGGGIRCESFTPHFLLCLPYRGHFVLHVGRDDVVGDANQVLFVTGGEGYRMSSPLPDGHAELLIRPELGVLSELVRGNGAHLSAHPLFRRRSWRANQHLQSFRARVLHWATDAPEVDDLEAEELVVALLRAALQDDELRATPCGPTTARLIRQAKEFLEAELSNSIRLADVGHAVGASPAYLTDTFRRVEGISLHQYLTRLRLARALVELPHAADLTTLALDVGFSSHSHFAAAFRRRFGCTPSEFRHTTRRAARPLATTPSI